MRGIEVTISKQLTLDFYNHHLVLPNSSSYKAIVVENKARRARTKARTHAVAKRANRRTVIVSKRGPVHAISLLYALLNSHDLHLYSANPARPVTRSAFSRRNLERLKSKLARRHNVAVVVSCNASQSWRQCGSFVPDCVRNQALASPQPSQLCELCQCLDPFSVSRTRCVC